MMTNIDSTAMSEQWLLLWSVSFWLFTIIIFYLESIFWEVISKVGFRLTILSIHLHFSNYQNGQFILPNSVFETLHNSDFVTNKTRPPDKLN